MKRAGSRVNIRIKGNGPLDGILVDAGLDGTVRGYVDNPSIECHQMRRANWMLVQSDEMAFM